MKNLIIIILAVLTSLPLASASESEWFDLDEYYELKAKDEEALYLILSAMYETNFYTRHVVEGAVICATPIPPSAQELIAIVEQEIKQPTNAIQLEYNESSHVAYILVNGLVAAEHNGCT
ncbi:MAG: hypothetical protein RIC29_05965 [Rhodospirillaceae bacterium]